MNFKVTKLDFNLFFNFFICTEVVELDSDSDDDPGNYMMEQKFIPPNSAQIPIQGSQIAPVPLQIKPEPLANFQATNTVPVHSQLGLASNFIHPTQAQVAHRGMLVPNQILTPNLQPSSKASIPFMGPMPMVATGNQSSFTSPHGNSMAALPQVPFVGPVSTPLHCGTSTSCLQQPVSVKQDNFPAAQHATGSQFGEGASAIPQSNLPLSNLAEVVKEICSSYIPKLLSVK